jgi:hypothetical protein
MKFIKKYLILCLLFVMPLQSIAASFQLACQDNHKTSMVAEKKMSHCHQTKAHNEAKKTQNFNASHHCLSFCAQVGMTALTHNIDLAIRQDKINTYTHYSYHYDSVILPHIQRPPIRLS